jgi:hypothetical protein
MGLILLVVLALLLLGSLPAHRYTREWGYRPAGLLGLLFVVFLVLLLVGTVPWGFGPRTVYVANPAPVVVQPRPVTVINPPPQQGSPVVPATPNQ